MQGVAPVRDCCAENIFCTAMGKAAPVSRCQLKVGLTAHSCPLSGYRVYLIQCGDKIAKHHSLVKIESSIYVKQGFRSKKNRCSCLPSPREELMRFLGPLSISVARGDFWPGCRHSVAVATASAVLRWAHSPCWSSLLATCNGHTGIYTQQPTASRGESTSTCAWFAK